MQMNDDFRTNELAARMDDAAYPQPPAGDAAPGSPLGAAHRALRGRYLWAAGLGVLLAGAGVYSVYQFVPAVYRSTGIIEVSPQTIRIVYRTEENEALNSYDTFVESQVAWASSRRVVDMAMASPEWTQLGRGVKDEDIVKFASSLQVARMAKAQSFAVSFVDVNPDAATVAVNQVIKAYMKLVEERDVQSAQQRLSALESKRNVINGRLKDLDKEVLGQSDNLGAGAIEGRYNSKIAEMSHFDETLSQLDIEIATLRAAGEAAGTAPSHVMSELEIGHRDQRMARLLETKIAAQRMVKNLLEVEHLGTAHWRVVDAKQQLEAIERDCADEASDFRASIVQSPEERAANLTDRLGRRTQIVALREAVQADVKRLGQTRLAISAIERDKGLLSEQLSEVRARLEQLNTESVVQGRINVVGQGDRPLAPDNDKRTPLAAFAGIGGIALGFGLVMLRGLRDARLRYISDVDAKSGRGHFIGIIPEVADQALGEVATGEPSMADFCVHHVRTLLQLRASGEPRVVALTSPSPGDGKTTLSLALGMSFAATGARTLLVDCDLVGHGLTSAMRSIVCEAASRALLSSNGDGAGPAIGNGRKGLVDEVLATRSVSFTDEQIAELLAAARSAAEAGSQEAGGRVRALDAFVRNRGTNGHAQRRRGTMGVLDGAPLEDCVLDVDIPNLTLLPVGDTLPNDAESLSPSAMRRLLAACRERYDTVLVDTGPILGSLEASLAAVAADYVLLVVSRGGQESQIQEALSRLDKINASVAGVVFNRASAEDVATSSYSAGSSRRSVDVEAT